MMHHRVQLAANLVVQLRDMVVNQALIQLFNLRTRFTQAIQEHPHAGGQTLIGRCIRHRLIILPDIQRAQL